MKNNTRFIIGAILIALGILFLIDQTGIFGPLGFNIWTLVFKLWPLILVYLGIKIILEKNTIAGSILVVIGALILLSNLFNWNFFAIFWPVIIITIGLSIILKKEGETINPTSSEEEVNNINATVAFWGLDKKIISNKFEGGNITVAFGGAKLDLRNTKISKDGALLTVNAAFGGVDIIVPKDCKVKVSGTGILGGWESKVEERKIDSPVLEISGVAAFAGIEIKE